MKVSVSMSDYAKSKLSRHQLDIMITTAYEEAKKKPEWKYGNSYSKMFIVGDDDDDEDYEVCLNHKGDFVEAVIGLKGHLEMLDDRDFSVEA